MTAGGNRIFVEDENDGGTIEVLDWMICGEWRRDIKLRPNNSSTTQLLSWKSSGDGRRTIVTTKIEIPLDSSDVEEVVRERLRETA